MERRRREGRLPSNKPQKRSNGGGGFSLIGLILLPIRLLWRLVTFILRLGGRLLTLVLGLALIIVGLLITVLTGGLLGICGVPLALFGSVLLFRAIF